MSKHRHPAGAESDDDVSAAALQYVRKVAGTRTPSRANQAVFARAVDEVAEATRRLLEEWAAPPAPAASVSPD